MRISKGLVALVLSALLYFPINAFTQDAAGQTQEQTEKVNTVVDPRLQEIIQFILENGDEEFIQGMHDFFTVLDEAGTHYVDEKKMPELLILAMKGMVSGLDPYSYVYVNNKETQERLKGFSEDKYIGGIGISFERSRKYIFVTEVYEGFPADKAGIRQGDIIKKVGDRIVYGMSPDQVADLIKGKNGTSVSLEIESAHSQKPVIFNLTRQPINVKSVVYNNVKKDIGYIKVRAFNERGETASEFSSKLCELSRAGKSKLILDLRDNGGGSVDTVIDMVGQFVGLGKVVMFEKRRDEPPRFLATTSTNECSPRRVVVLINNYSASASEIMVGNLKYYGKKIGDVKVVGVRSFGKALVQRSMDLETEDHGLRNDTRLMMAITTDHYYLPGGANGEGEEVGQDITGTGVMPDIEVEQPDNFKAHEYRTKRDVQFQEAIKILENI